jgi:hypothetical protein
MRILRSSLIFWMVLSIPFQVLTAQVGDAVIESPRPGDVLQGVVAVIGSSKVNGFKSAEISFSYMDDPTGTWFLLANNVQPVSKSTLATWDTTVITDANYVLRLRVNLTDESSQEFLVSELHVRNYTPVETPTPLPVTPEATPLPTSTATLETFPTPTALGQNPAILAPMDVTTSIFYGGLAAILTFIIIGIYLWLRRK